MNDKQDLKFLRAAIKVAQKKSKSGENGPFGAVVVKDGNIISQGWNQVVQQQDPTAHAEITAIRRACQKLSTNQLNGCTLYSSCEPCPMCFSAILWARLDRIVFSATRQEAAEIGFDDVKILQEVQKKWNQREIPNQHIPTKEAQQVFQNWANNPNKKTY